MAGVLVLAERERLDVKVLSHSEMSQKCSCQWAERQATGMTPYVPHDFGKTLTATQEGKLFSLLFSQAAAWLKAKWVTLLDTPNQPTALIFHTDGSCVSKQHAAKDKRRRESVGAGWGSSRGMAIFYWLETIIETKAVKRMVEKYNKCINCAQKHEGKSHIFLEISLFAVLLSYETWLMVLQHMYCKY